MVTFEEDVDREVCAGEGGDEILGGVHMAFADRLAGLPRLRDTGRIVGISGQEGRVGERDDDMPAGANAPVDLTEDPVEIFDEAQCSHRHGEIDLVGSNEGELGRTGLVKFDRDVVFGGEGAGGGDLFGGAVGRDHARAASSEPDGRVAGTAAEVEDLAAASIADHAMVDVVDESGAEFDLVERASARRPRVVARHGRHDRPRRQGERGRGTLAGHDGAHQAGPPARRHLRRDRLSVGARGDTGGVSRW